MRRVFAVAVTTLALLIGAHLALAAAPKLVSSDPADGATGVAVDLQVMRLVFDQNMKMNQYTLWESEKGPFPPLAAGDPVKWLSPTEFQINLGPLSPNTRYVIQLNSDTRQGFRSALQDVAMPVTFISFTTGPGDAAAVGNAAPAPTGGKGAAMGQQGQTGSLVGLWLMRNQEMELVAQFTAQGAYMRRVLSAEGIDEISGTYRLQGNQLILKPQNENEYTTLYYRFIDQNTVEIVDDQGEGFRMIRATPQDITPQGQNPYMQGMGQGGMGQGGMGQGGMGQGGQGGMGQGGQGGMGQGGQGGMGQGGQGQGGMGQGGYGNGQQGGSQDGILPGGGGSYPQQPMNRNNQQPMNQNNQQPGMGITPQSGSGETAAPVPPNQALTAMLPKLEQSPSGHIVYVRYELMKVQTAQLNETIPVPKLFVMRGDGGGQAPFLVPPGYTQVTTPRWSPDYGKLLFSSDWELAKSALYMDVFMADMKAHSVSRLTGNAWFAGAPKGYGQIIGVVWDDTVAELDQTMGEDSRLFNPKDTISVSYQGGNGKIVKLSRNVADVLGDRAQGRDAYKWAFSIPNAPVGKIWVKCWRSKHLGCLKIVDVTKDGTAEIEMRLTEGNYLATNASISPDGRYLALLSQHAYTIPGKPFSQKLERGGGTLTGHQMKQGGYDTVALVDLARGGQCVSMWEPSKMNGKLSSSPAMSPDGRWIALSAGDNGMEDLVVIPVQQFAAGQVQVRVVAPGKQVLGSHTEGNTGACWSPDGSRLAFVRYRVGAGYMTGNLFVVNADGSGLTQVTQVAGNQMAASPCWSPDGRQIAFQLVTSKGQVLSLVELIMKHITSDIYAVDLAQGAIRRLTNDGRSAEPAWGM